MNADGKRGWLLDFVIAVVIVAVVICGLWAYEVATGQRTKVEGDVNALSAYPIVVTLKDGRVVQCVNLGNRAITCDFESSNRGAGVR